MKFQSTTDKERKLSGINWGYINTYTSRWKPDTVFDIEIKRHQETVSDPQRKWYFSKVLPVLARELGYDPHEDMLVHEQLKIRYFNIEPDKRGIYRNVPSVFSNESDIPVPEKSEFIEWVLRIATEYDVYIETP